MQSCRGSDRCTETFSLKKDKLRQRAKEYKLVATPADFEEPSLKYDVERGWKKLRAARAEECWRFTQHHQSMFRAHLEKACASSNVKKQLRTKQEKERCRQRALESAQAGYEAMDAELRRSLTAGGSGAQTPHSRRQAAKEASPIR